MTLTKADLAAVVAESIGLRRRESLALVDTFFDEIANGLVSGDEVKLSGFGVFETRKKTARMGRNPRTKEAALITARRVVTFYPSSKLNEKVVKAHKP